MNPIHKRIIDVNSDPRNDIFENVESKPWLDVHYNVSDNVYKFISIRAFVLNKFELL